MTGPEQNREHDPDPEGYYRLLGASSSPTFEEIKLARWQALRRLDGKRDAASLRKWIEDAYAVLSDPIKRARYDGREQERPASPPPRQENPAPRPVKRIRRRSDLDTSPKLDCVPPVLDFGKMQPGQSARQRVAVNFQNVDSDKHPVWIENEAGLWYFADLMGQEERGSQSALTVQVMIPSDMKPGAYEATVKLGIDRPDPQLATYDDGETRISYAVTTLCSATFTVRVTVVQPLEMRITHWAARALAWMYPPWLLILSGLILLSTEKPGAKLMGAVVLLLGIVRAIIRKRKTPAREEWENWGVP